MKFSEFWPLYLREHSLPGTRAMHYVASIIGLMAAVEAVIAREPWIFIGGIALAYGLAIVAHWTIERNQPLILVDPLRGAFADLRMVWLALTGRIERELENRGLPVTVKAKSELPKVVALCELELAARNALNCCDKRFHRYALLSISAAGLTIVAADLHDLIEPLGKPAYPLVQLGIPIVAFAAALILSCRATRIGREQLNTIHNWFAVLERQSLPNSAAESEIERFEQRLELQSAHETSLRRASATQVALGVTVFAAAELTEMVMAAPALG